MAENLWISRPRCFRAAVWRVLGCCSSRQQQQQQVGQQAHTAVRPRLLAPSSPLGFSCAPLLLCCCAVFRRPYLLSLFRVALNNTVVFFRSPFCSFFLLLAMNNIHFRFDDVAMTIYLDATAISSCQPSNEWRMTSFGTVRNPH